MKRLKKTVVSLRTIFSAYFLASVCSKAGLYNLAPSTQCHNLIVTLSTKYTLSEINILCILFGRLHTKHPYLLSYGNINIYFYRFIFKSVLVKVGESGRKQEKVGENLSKHEAQTKVHGLENSTAGYTSHTKSPKVC